jgi:site-specific DNA-methyltransferase (adenine-specific)
MSRRRSKRCHDDCSNLTLLEGDCLELLGTIKSESIDSVVTDPPYGIGFQKKDWDSRSIREAVDADGENLSPSEAFQRWCALWGAGCLQALKPGGHILAFGSSRTFHRLAAGLEDAGFELRDTLMWLYGSGMPKSRRLEGGRGTALKPGFEPIVLARRPLAGTVAQTIDAFGTGALEVESCRVGERYPPNVALAHDPGCEEKRCAKVCPVRQLDCDARSHRVSGQPVSRFFYCPKTSRRERDAGCEKLSARSLDLFPNASKRSGVARNPHPTVKPLELMRWLVRLACPPNGLVLDPFAGSGTTGAAVGLEGRRFLGIERESAYAEIAAARIGHWTRSDCEVRRGPLARRP